MLFAFRFLAIVANWPLLLPKNAVVVVGVEEPGVCATDVWPTLDTVTEVVAVYNGDWVDETNSLDVPLPLLALLLLVGVLEVVVAETRTCCEERNTLFVDEPAIMLLLLLPLLQLSFVFCDSEDCTLSRDAGN